MCLYNSKTKSLTQNDTTIMTDKQNNTYDFEKTSGRFKTLDVWILKEQILYSLLKNLKLGNFCSTLALSVGIKNILTETIFVQNNEWNVLIISSHIK